MIHCRVPCFRPLLSEFLLVLVFVSLAMELVEAQQLIATVPIGQLAQVVVVNSATRKVYVGGIFETTIIDEDTLTTATIGITNPTSMAVDEIRNKIYASSLGGLTIIDGATNTTTLVSLFAPRQLALNQVTNKIYVIGVDSNVFVVDGETLSTTSVTVGNSPSAIAVNTVTNKIYVCNSGDTTLTVIDGATNSTTTVELGYSAYEVAVNTNTNKIFVPELETLSIIDGATLSIQNVTVPPGFSRIVVDQRLNNVYGITYQVLAAIHIPTLYVTQIPLGQVTATRLAVEPITNRIYIPFSRSDGTGVGLFAINGANGSIHTVFTDFQPIGSAPLVAVDSADDRIYVPASGPTLTYVVAGPTPLRFVPLTPCRVVDTRLPNGPLGGPAIQGGTERDFPLPQGQCNIPPNASAYSLNVTVVPHQQLGYLTVWPTGEMQPPVSTMNSVDGRVKANAAIVPAGLGGSVSAFANGTTDVIVDINGYFASANAMALAFYPLSSCRMIDTRGPNAPYLSGGQERDFSVLGACGVPSTALAYSLNVTALPHRTLGYLTVWPEGQQRPLVSTLNAQTGATTANAALVTGGVGGEIAAYASDDTDMLVDVNGYFAPIGPGGMSLYTITPCRALDTRSGRGAFQGTALFDIVDSGCGLAEAEVYVMNATVVPQGPLQYLTIWPTTEMRPSTSTLNAADGVITSNLAIVPNIDGWLDVFAPNATNLILDGFGYFAP